MRRKNKTPPQLEYFGSGRYTPIHDELIKADAYKALKPTARLVLLDMIRRERRLSYGNKHLYEGFTYTWGHCNEDVSEETFRQAVHRVVELGFFTVDPDIQEGRPGAPIRYQASRKWEQFKLDAEAVKKQDRRLARKKARIANKRKRRTDYRASLGEIRKKRNPKNQADSTPKKYADADPDNGHTTTKIGPT